MQTALSQRTFVGQTVRAAPSSSRVARSSNVIVRASAEESRRAVLGGFLAGAAALTALSANALDIIDDRKAKKAGFDLIYEARDLDLPQNVRDGLSQVRTDAAAAKKRLAESKRRIETEVEPLISKNYWPVAREEIRRQVGTLRFDINALADALPKDAKKSVLAAKKDLLSEMDQLDFALRKKNTSAALKELADTKAALSTVLSKLA